MQINGNEFILYGTVGIFGWWGDDGFTAADVVNALADRKGEAITVRINSGGGLVDEGVAIYNALANHDAAVTVFIDGIAASAATIIAAAGSEIVVRTGATMMIHDPLTYTQGNAAAHQKTIDMLETTANAMAQLYAKRSGRTADQVRADMKAETWLTGDQAVAMGYADRTDGAAAVEASAFDYRVYMRAPESILALADARKWSKPTSERTNMTTKPKATDPAPEPAPAPAPVSEPKIEDPKVEEPTIEEQVAAAIKADRDRVAALSQLCTDEKEPGMLAAFITDNITLEAAKQKIEGAKAIRTAVEAARKTNPGIEASLADQYLAEGKTAEQASADLFRRMTALQSQTTTKAHHGSTVDNGQSHASLWDDAIATVNATLPGAKKAAA